MNECKFFHTPGDGNFYLINCSKILYDSDDNDDNGTYDHGFFYKYLTAKYHITCKLYSHSLIENILNKEVFGMNITINDLQQKESLTINQKLSLQEGLERILPSHFLQYHVPDSITVQTTDNGLSLQNINGVGDNQQQQILQYHRETSTCYNANTNSFHENNMNNVSTTQVIPMMDINQNYINDNDLSCNNDINIVHQGFVNPPQQVDLPEFSHHNIPEKEIIHPLQDNIVHAFSTMDINRDYNNTGLSNDNYISQRGVIGIENYHNVTYRVNSQDFSIENNFK
ncbi:hypothetical protein RclHR1_09010005 [Rhizophagus clarus]|uniref:Uncharacterized protein n=1 Tax=Rhizophagus clarus TaxID=94130 RepID=A0A2Z6SHH7_9GLOM|nr:hypothetical protein RclHR1_09010005 [Rhizophagus clarus]GES73940.1 hypothetical protein GLOIN_2v1497260 [Rhizophagus clarus]